MVCSIWSIGCSILRCSLLRPIYDSGPSACRAYNPSLANEGQGWGNYPRPLIVGSAMWGYVGAHLGCPMGSALLGAALSGTRSVLDTSPYNPLSSGYAV